MNNFKDYMMNDLKPDILSNFDKETREELIKKLGDYNEEIVYQNYELKAANRTLEELKEKYENLFMNSPVPYLILNEKLSIVNFNTYARILFQNDNLLNADIRKYIDEVSLDTFNLHIRDLKHIDKVVSCTIEMNIKNEVRNVKIFSNVMRENGLYMCTIIDETMDMQYKREIEYLSYHDQLTGVYNRRYFDKFLKKIDGSDYNSLGIIIADLNGLKLANDAFGHGEGDKLLMAAANLFIKNSRKEDKIIRYGGDEFCIVIEDTSEKYLNEIVNRMERASEDLCIENIRLSISFGFAIKTKVDQSILSVIKLAEDRMYRNKLLNNTSQRKRIVIGILSTLHDKLPDEEIHSKRVSEYAYKLGVSLNLSEVQINNLKMAGLLHDIGKIAINEKIISKPDTLSKDEFIQIQKHSEVGYKILASTNVFKDVAEIVLSHHERVDGNGYPRRLGGRELSIEAKIISICDAYDSMISDKCYRKAIKKKAALKEIELNSGTQFDEKIASQFIKLANIGVL